MPATSPDEIMNTILLIDDDDVLRGNYKDALETNGYRVIEASSGNDGFDLARKYLPDLILTDIAMPNGDGESVLRKIRQEPTLSRKQVVLITGDLNNATPRKGMEAGADDFLLKPVSMDTLIKCVRARLLRAAIHWRVEDSMLAQLRFSLNSTLPHEFFAPLAGIIGLSEMLCSESEMASAQVTRELGREIRSSALRLHRTVKNHLLLLELKDKEEDFKSVLIPSLLPASVRENIHAAVGEVLVYAKRQGDLKVVVEDCSIHVDPADLRVIVSELTDNACEFSPHGAAVTVNMDSDGVLTITDAGREMTLEEIAQLTDPQSFDSHKLEEQTIGIGLFLVQKLVDRCGGKFSIESSPPEGTRMQVAFRSVQHEGS
jgi:two-component system sensor histidine kinase/response regulator